MLSNLKGKVTLAVMSAAKRGNPLAKQLVTQETKRFASTLPDQSPIIAGDYMIPDLNRPLPEDMQGGMLGDYEMKALDITPIQSTDLKGRKVAAAMISLGSYGVGTHGFFGLLFEDEHWLVVPVHMARSWLSLDGRILEDERDTRAWIKNGDDAAMSDRLMGAEITEAMFAAHALALEFDNGASLRIAKDPAQRPKFPDGAARAFLPTDNLANAVFLSPSGEIFV